MDSVHQLKTLAKALNDGKASNKYQTITAGLEGATEKAKGLIETIESMYQNGETDLTTQLSELSGLQDEYDILKSATKEALRIGKSKGTST